MLLLSPLLRPNWDGRVDAFIGFARALYGISASKSPAGMVARPDARQQSGVNYIRTIPFASVQFSSVVAAELDF